MKLPNLPKEYQIFPHSVPFVIPDFEKTYREGDAVLSLNDINTKQWFEEFIVRIEQAIKKNEFLPICRMSDGEFMFCVGEKLPSIRTGFLNRTVYLLRRTASKIVKGNNFRANTLPTVPSGNYTQSERKSALLTYAVYVKELSEKGILALDLTYWEEPFQEQYFPDFKKWLLQNGIDINTNNYFPFYFVYASLLGPVKSRILKDRNVLIVHSASGAKREKIESELYKIGVKNVEWLTISADRSLYDRIDIKGIKQQPNLCLIGAGVGKPNIMLQLEQLKVPCIDAGYVFEVWHNSENQWKRRYCTEDELYVADKINF